MREVVRRLPVPPRHLVAALSLLLFAWIAFVTAWLSDDSFISLRQVLNAISGEGFTWNFGQRVQAFTHPTWVLLLTVASAITRELYFTTIILSVLLSLAAIYFVSAYASRLPRGRCTPLFLLLFLVGLAFSKAFTDYMTSGLENPLSFFLVGLVLWQACKIDSRGSDVRTLTLLFALLALAFLNRFDYALLLLPVSIYLLVEHVGVRHLRVLTPGVLMIGAWLGFALLYFGTPLPNTYYAKMVTGFPLAEIHARGAAYYTVSFTKDPVTAALIVLGVVAGIVGRGWLNRSLSLGMLLYGGYIYHIGGDFMQGRLFSLPAYIAVFNLVSIDETTLTSRRLKAAAALVTLGLIALGPKPLLSDGTYRNLEQVDGVGDGRGSWYEPYGLLSPARQWPRIGAPATRRPTEYRLSCAGSDGLIRRDVFWIDVCGLFDPLTSRLPAIRSRDWRIGHHVRKVPTDYGNVLVGRTSELHDADLQGLFDDVQLVVSGPLFSVERMKAIIRLNTPSSYRYDRQKYTDPTLQLPLSSLLARVDYARVNHEPPADGERWVRPMAEGVVWMQDWVATSFDVGLLIVAQPAIVASAVSLSLDGNDSYRVTINGGEHVTRIEKSSRVGARGGLVSHRIELAEPRSIALVQVEPIEGDGYYGLGHLLIEGSR